MKTIKDLIEELKQFDESMGVIIHNVSQTQENTIDKINNKLFCI